MSHSETLISEPLTPYRFSNGVFEKFSYGSQDPKHIPSLLVKFRVPHCEMMRRFRTACDFFKKIAQYEVDNRFKIHLEVSRINIDFFCCDT